jgi:hypothetical protein
MIVFDGNYYHGSIQTTLERLDIAFSREPNPFGPAIYLTKDKAVAACYIGTHGRIYCVSVVGDPDYTINLDEAVENQTDKAIDAIRRLSKLRYKSTDILGQNAGTIIHPVPKDTRFANSFLRNRGIWMLYGHLDVYLDSGLRDRGVQYAVLDNLNVTITRALHSHQLYG